MNNTLTNTQQYITQNNFVLNLPNSLQPLIVLSGQEPYLMSKFQQQIISHWKKNNSTISNPEIFNKVTVEINSAQCWKNLFNSAKELCLFADCQLFIGNFPGTTLDQKSQEIIQEYLKTDNINSDQRLVIIMAPLLNNKTTNFLKSLPNNNVVYIKIPAATVTKKWIEFQLNKYHFTFTSTLIDLIYSQTEGNLTACAQGITKLMLCYPTGAVLNNNIILDHFPLEFIVNSFELTNQILSGNTQKAILIMKQQIQESDQFHLVLWQVAQINRQIYQLKYDTTIKNIAFDKACTKLNIWSDKIKNYKIMCNKSSLKQLESFIKIFQNIDLDSKTGNYEAAVRNLEYCIIKLSQLR